MVNKQEADEKVKIFAQKYKEIMISFNKLEEELTRVQNEIKRNNKMFESFESEDIRLRNEIKYEAKNLT